MEEWKDSKSPGLTIDTFTAWIQTLYGVADAAVYLIEKHNFDYVLLAKFLSDPLEGRFGLYRQLNGASFFMSVRQVLLAEKKLRVLNLMELQCLQIANEFDDVDTVFDAAVDDVLWLSSFLTIPEQCNLDDTDSNLVYYVAGCIGRSVGRVKKCEECHHLLLLSTDIAESNSVDSASASVPTTDAMINILLFLTK